MILTFLPPRRIKTPIGRARIWQSKCGRYRVRESKPAGLATLYYAQVIRREMGVIGGMRASTVYWDIISQHRSRRAALLACEKCARKSARKAGAK